MKKIGSFLQRLLAVVLCMTITTGCFGGMALPVKAQEEKKEEYGIDTLSGNEMICDHSNTKTVTNKATLEKNGSITKKCAACGEVITKKTIYKVDKVLISKVNYTYTGKKITPTITVKDSKGNKLVKDTDYTIKYSSSTRKNTGKYKITVTFKGKYSGTKERTFYILPGRTSKITHTRGTSYIKANWKKVTGATGYKVELLSSSGKVLRTKYTKELSYKFTDLSSGKTYKIRVTAYKTVNDVKKYSLSSRTKTVVTAPKKPTLKVTAKSKSAALSWKKVTGSGYQIVYSTSSKFTSPKKITVTSSSTLKKTIKNLKKGKTYYFKVRAYKKLDDVKIYGNYSSVVKVKIK